MVVDRGVGKHLPLELCATRPEQLAVLDEEDISARPSDLKLSVLGVSCCAEFSRASPTP